MEKGRGYCGVGDPKSYDSVEYFPLGSQVLFEPREDDVIEVPQKEEISGGEERIGSAIRLRRANRKGD